MRETQWTILNLLKWTTAYFHRHAIESPRAAAEILLAHTLDLARIDLYLRYDQPLHSEELARFKALIQRRVQHEPVAYLVGMKAFWSLELRVNHNVLIPRPETECLVEGVLDYWSQNPSRLPARVLELGTGAGGIILALASEYSTNQYFGCDASPPALQVARHNAYQHGLQAYTHFFGSHWFEALCGRDNGFDVIVSNPPYIRHHELAQLQPEIYRHEPHLALDGGAEGLDAIGIIVDQAHRYLKPGGVLFIEIGHDQRAPVAAMLTNHGAYRAVVFRRDFQGHDRVVRAERLTVS